MIDRPRLAMALAPLLCCLAALPAAAAPSHLFLVVMENRGPSEIFGNAADAPFINQLIRQPGVWSATHYFGVTHPSLPNYLALLSGSSQGIFDDCAAGAAVTCRPHSFAPGRPGPTLSEAQATAAAERPHLFAGPTLVDQLEASGRSWTAYMQALPADDPLAETAPTGIPLYAQKHDPFVYFSTIRDDPRRLGRIRPFDAFAADLAADHLADLVWITPDQCHDMHGIPWLAALALLEPGCGDQRHGAIRLGDAFLRELVGAITASVAWARGAAIVIVWDEEDGGAGGIAGSPTGRDGVVLGGGRAPLILVTGSAEAPRTIDRPLNHYDLLAALQSLWGLGCLAESCGRAAGNPIAAALAGAAAPASQ
jgi:hypothetical protein